MATRFMLRDARDEEPEFKQVSRELYKKCARLHDRSGQPLRTDTTYEDGIPVKWLTLMEKTGATYPQSGEPHGSEQDTSHKTVLRATIGQFFK